MVFSFWSDYRVIEKIGEGSFSEVIKCQNTTSGLFYAGKRLKRIYYTNEEILESAELLALQKITCHPNILYLVEFHSDPLPGKVTLIYELMEMSLYDLIKRQRGRVMPEQKIKIYFYQLLRGLNHLHNHGIIHRDIKPENILIKGHTVKLGDLGSIQTHSKPPYTEYISTRWYRAPECLLTAGFYGPKIDIWALGCVFYELLTLKPLFPGSSEIDQISKINTVLGTPYTRLLSKFQMHKSKNCDFIFPIKSGTGFRVLLPSVSEAGREVLKHMLIYNPVTRATSKKLLDHRYFKDLREYCHSSISNRWEKRKTLPRRLNCIKSPAKKIAKHDVTIINL